MAGPNGSYTQVGAIQDVSKRMERLETTKTPFQTLIGTEKIKNKVHMWHEDALAAPALNAKVEGADAVIDDITPTSERQNVTQILKKAFGVSGTVQAIDFHARESEMARATANKAAELKRDLEYSLVGSKQVSAAGNSSTARQMAGVQALIDAGNIIVTGGVSTPVSEAKLFDAMEILYKLGADADTIMVTPTDAREVANWAAASGRTRDFGTGTKLVVQIDLIVTPFGQAKVVLNQHLAAGDTLVFNPSKWKLLTLRPWERETLAVTGDSTKMEIRGEFSLRHDHIKASALVRRSA